MASNQLNGRIVAIDVETTGLDPQQDRIVSFAAVEMIDGKLAPGAMYLVFNPERPSHPAAARKHGLTDAYLARQPLFAVYAARIREFIGSSAIIAHNLEFDLSFINAEMARADVSAISRPGNGCTMRMFEARHPGLKKSLDAACSFYGLSRRGTDHNALEDAQLAANLLQAMNGLPTQSMSDLPRPLNEQPELKQSKGKTAGRAEFGDTELIQALAEQVCALAELNQSHSRQLQDIGGLVLALQEVLNAQFGLIDVKLDQGFSATKVAVGLRAMLLALAEQTDFAHRDLITKISAIPMPINVQPEKQTTTKPHHLAGATRADVESLLNVHQANILNRIEALAETVELTSERQASFETDSRTSRRSIRRLAFVIIVAVLALAAQAAWHWQVFRL